MTDLSEVDMRQILSVMALALFVAACSLMPDFGPRLARLDEPTVRTYMKSQTEAWVAHDFDRFYGLFSPGAQFVSVRWNGDGTITHERRTLDEDRAAAEAYFRLHPGKFTESDAIDRIAIAPDGLSARILGHDTAHIAGTGRPEVLHASTEQTVVLKNGRILSLGQTDTAAR
jgi:hypothetical protein